MEEAMSTRYAGSHVPGKLWRRMRRWRLEKVDLVRVWQGPDKHIIIQFTYAGHPFRRDLGRYDVERKWTAFYRKWYEPATLGFVVSAFIRHRLCERSFLSAFFGDPNEKEDAERLAMKKKLRKEEATEALKIHTFRLLLIRIVGQTVVARHALDAGGTIGWWPCGMPGIVMRIGDNGLFTIRTRGMAGGPYCAGVRFEDVEFLPDGCSDAFVRYKSLEQELKQLREKSDGAYAQEQGPVLDEMTEVWMQLPENEMDLLDAEGPQAKNIRATDGTTP
jgi:hypothetical protein